MNDKPAVDAKVLDLRDRVRANADVAQMARLEVAHARQAAACTEADFASQLSQYVDWDVTAELVTCWETDITPPGDILMAVRLFVDPESINLQALTNPSDLAGITAAFATRSDFLSTASIEKLFDDANRIEAAGLSHNLICQQYPTIKLINLLKTGTSIECLFLAPRGESIAQREEEEGYPSGSLTSLTELNISTLVTQVRAGLDHESSPRLKIGTYDETIRFNLIFLDDSVCIAQPYLHGVRGLETPTLMVSKTKDGGIYESLRACYDWLRARADYQ